MDGLSQHLGHHQILQWKVPPGYGFHGRYRVTEPDGTFYLYAKAPKGIIGGPIFATAEDCSQYLICNHLISTVPWSEAGEYLRFSVTFVAETEADEDAVLQEVQRRLHGCQFYF